MSLSIRCSSRFTRGQSRLGNAIFKLCRESLRNYKQFATTAAELRKTGLYDYHVANKAKMVSFGGYLMPLSYGDVGQVASHKHVRSDAGLFDVGHMVQSFIRGPSALPFLEHLTPSSLRALSPFSSTLSVLLNERGGIIDDLIITKHSDHEFYIVTNAGRRDRDLAWIEEQMQQWNEGRDDKVELDVLDNWGLLALQGPKAAAYLQKLTKSNLVPLTFGRAVHMCIDGVKVHVARGGYTGEDGFEISIPPKDTVHLAEILSQPPVQLIGLGARDSLRLEAGLCLYGHDLDEDTTPVEGGLTWVIAKSRREAGDFIGAERVINHLKNGPPRRRVGFIVDEAPAREGAEIFSKDGEAIGKVTSGIPSPTLGFNIAMGYVKNGFHKKGTEVQIQVRKALRKAIVKGMPFIETRYWRG
ncbi:glycine cleavage system T protein [Hysterangium stoloniferum]|nr:glycine cleavage system T protein [Hysterangium stoloniferum]